jgi:glycosyltransferase involved in cell wall biosynthesis
MNARPLRVCYFGTYRANYSRNQIMIEALRRNSVQVIECHEQLWQGIEDRVNVASGGWLNPRFLARCGRAYWRLLRAHRRTGEYDVMVLGYPGQLDAYLARLLTWIRRKPLVLDVFMSLFLIASERGLTARHRITSRLIFWLEKGALRLPDLLIQDTAEYVEWFERLFGVETARFRLVPTGADDRIFQPVEADRPHDGVFRALYYGTFIPNHGVEQIVEAARLLADDPAIRFELVGEGPDRERALSLARRHGLENVECLGWMDQKELVAAAAAADVCLGVFGTTPQSLMTIQNKIYEGLAMGKAVITGDARTVRESLVHGKHVYLCERGNPQALADAVRVLKEDYELRRSLEQSGYRLFQNRFSLQHNGARYSAHLRELVSGQRHGGGLPA